MERYPDVTFWYYFHKFTVESRVEVSLDHMLNGV